MALRIDGTIILAYFALIVTIGLYKGRREKTLHDFALGGRSVPWWAVMASIIAAETSAATFLGAPGEGYDKRSLGYVQLVLGVIIGRVLVGYTFLKPYYRYKVYTVYDYLGVRFGPWSKNYVSALFLVMRTLASGTRMFVPSLVMVLAWRMLRDGEHVQYSQQAVSNVGPYLAAIVILTIITCLYTAAGGIKAVIWTDVIQAVLMFGSALLAMGMLLYHVGGNDWNLLSGFRAVGQYVPQMKQAAGYFATGFELPARQKWMTDHHLMSMGLVDYVKLVLGSEYTLFSAVIGATFMNMAAFGTDQDMVQRLLTAETYRKSRRSLITAAVMDLPIGVVFTFIGILLYIYYQQDPKYKPASNQDVFGSYIINVMPVGIRGLVLAGVFATAMGSLSAALNALATSLTNDWYIPYFGRGKGEKHHVAVARVFTALFAILMIVIAAAFAYAKVKDPNLRILPVVLGIAGFILGPMLGVFLIGMLTRRRGSDMGNTIAITGGLFCTIFLGGLHLDALNLIRPMLGLQGNLAPPTWLPKIAFTWFALVGAVIVCAIGLCFRTPDKVLVAAEQRATEATTQDERPMSLRDQIESTGAKGK